jgi:CRP-like cAMP-binding protein
MEHNFEANFFTLLELLDPASRLEVEAACTPISIPPNQVIYRQGDPANTVYIVASGVAEALTESPDGLQTRSLGYMGRGDFFGELAVLTGQTRLGSVRASDGLELLWIEKSQFLNLLNKVPKMAAFFSRNLARRLHKTSSEAHLQFYSLDLSGALRHFELYTIFQAINQMRLTGELHLHNASNELIGSYFFHEGQGQYARFIHLDGLEAIWQGFVQMSPEGTFTFQVMDKPVLPFSEEHRIELDMADLLTEGTTRRKLYQSLPEPWRGMEGSLRRQSKSLAWSDAETSECATHVWEMLGPQPHPLSSLWRRLNYSSLTFLKVVNGLVETNQAEWSPEKAAG